MIAPILSNTASRKLCEINPHLEAKWNRKRKLWEIWFNNHITRPYIIMFTPDHLLDERTYTQMRHNLQFSQHLYKNILKRQEEIEEGYKKRNADEKDMYEQLGKEAAPLLDSLQDAGNASHGRSKTMFEGVGESKPNY